MERDAVQQRQRRKPQQCDTSMTAENQTPPSATNREEEEDVPAASQLPLKFTLLSRTATYSLLNIFWIN